MRALFLAAAIALPAFGRAERPLWTAGILSDSHVGRTRESCDLVAKACRLFAEHDVDLFVNCGDIADRHYPEAYPILREISDTAFPRKPAKKIWVYAYHEWIDRLKEPWQAVMADVKRMLGAENDLFETIDFRGFPLIVLPQWWNGTEADRAKVTAMLDDASARHPTGPIFVFDHVPGTGTTENSQTWGNVWRRQLFSRYPRIIHIAGHTHGSLRSELNVWQGEYTTVNATCLHVWEGHSVGQVPPAKRNYGALIMEVYPSRVDFRRFDVRTGREYGTNEVWSVPLPFDPATAPYRRDRASAREPVPQFDAGAKLALAPDAPFSALSVSFPEATSPHGTYLYQVQVLSARGEPLTRCDWFGQFYRAEDERTPTNALSLSAGYFDAGETYQVRVTPCNCFGGRGRPLSASFTAPAARTSSSVTFESADPTKECPFLTELRDGTRLTADADGWYAIGSGNYRLEFPADAWAGAAGERFRFTVDMETEQEGERAWTLVLRNPEPLKNANERVSTPTGSSGRMRYLIEFAQRDASYRYYFLVREGGKGRIRFNHVKIEKLQDRGRAEGDFLTKENTTDESQHSIVPGRLFT